MKRLSIYIPFFISLVVIFIPKRTARACGFYVAPGEYRFWLLQPDITNQSDLIPFFFASGPLYKGDMNAAVETYVEENVDEWLRQIKGKASKKDVHDLLNATEPEYFFDEHKMVSNTNGFLRFLQQPQNSELYRYIILSKKVEQISFKPDPWEEDNYNNNNISEVIAEAENFQRQARSSFVKLRVAYQLMRLYSYSYQRKRAFAIYDSLIEPVKTNSWIKTAALYQKTFGAGTEEGNYWLSKVFDKGNYHKTACLVRFISDDADGALMLARNQHETNVILAMKAFNYPGRCLDILQQIYRTEPRYKELPFLLLREINKVEDWLVTSKVTDFGMPAVYMDTAGYSYNDSYLDDAAGNYKSDKKYAKELYSFVVKMINDRVHTQQGLLQLYASHLCLIQHDHKGAAQHLALAKLYKNLPANVQTQIRINTFLLHLEDGFMPTTENEFMSIIQTSSEKLGVYDAEIMKNQLVLYTAKKMIKQQDKARGLMLLSRTNRAFGELPISQYKDAYDVIEEEAVDKDYDQILSVLAKKKKSAFERFITEHWSVNRLLDGKASWYIRQHRLQDALAIMQQIPDSVWHQYPYEEYLGGDPFFVNIYQPHVPDTADKRQFTKKQVVQHMLQLQQLAKSNPSKAAWCYYQLGNACYNMSWHGKSWLMVKRYWSRGEDGAATLSLFNDDYFGCQRAKDYYRRAMEAANDKKLASLCFFMMQQCDEHYQYYSWVSKPRHKWDDDYPDEWKPDFTAAKKKGIDVSYYKSLVQECELYQSFIRQYVRPAGGNK